MYIDVPRGVYYCFILDYDFEIGRFEEPRNKASVTPFVLLSARPTPGVVPPPRHHASRGSYRKINNFF